MAKGKGTAGMPLGAAGADSSTEVVHTIYGKTLLEHASGLFGGPPRFWGRYFKIPEQQGGTQYNPKTEHAALASAGIRVVPIARQTGRIHGTKADGAQDANGNVLASSPLLGWIISKRKAESSMSILTMKAHPTLRFRQTTGRDGLAHC